MITLGVITLMLSMFYIFEEEHCIFQQVYYIFLFWLFYTCRVLQIKILLYVRSYHLRVSFFLYNYRLIFLYRVYVFQLNVAFLVRVYQLKVLFYIHVLQLKLHHLYRVVINLFLHLAYLSSYVNKKYDIPLNKNYVLYNYLQLFYRKINIVVGQPFCISASNCATLYLRKCKYLHLGSQNFCQRFLTMYSFLHSSQYLFTGGFALVMFYSRSNFRNFQNYKEHMENIVHVMSVLFCSQTHQSQFLIFPDQWSFWPCTVVRSEGLLRVTWVPHTVVALPYCVWRIRLPMVAFQPFHPDNANITYNGSEVKPLMLSLFTSVN